MIPTKELDHEGTGKKLLLEQFKYNTPVLQGLLGVFLRRCQELEDIFWDIIEKRHIDVAAGAQLDSLGLLVGEKRLERDDTDYRQAIRLRIRVNRSKGRIVDVIDVAILAGDPEVPRVTEYPFLGFEVELYNTPGERYVAELLNSTRAATSKGIYNAAALPASQLLILDDAANPGSSTAYLDDASNPVSTFMMSSGYGLPAR